MTIFFPFVWWQGVYPGKGTIFNKITCTIIGTIFYQIQNLLVSTRTLSIE
jgi:hypothetical protein